VEIAGSAPANDELSFVHAAFTQVSLPRTKQKNRDYFHRVGETWMRVNAGSISLDGNEHQRDLPYGALARLAIARINTHVVRYGVREVPIAGSAPAWLKALGKSDSKLHADRARSVLADLSACTLVLGRGDRTTKESIVRSVQGWQKGPHGQLWPTGIEVSRDYFEDLKAHAVPLDFRALRALSGSSLALDIYTWLSYRLHRVKAPERISWSAIEAQFATASEVLGDWRGSWRRAFKRQLSAVQVVYAGGAVYADSLGVVIRHCKPPVSRLDVDKDCA
jgi:hypothetical protein